MSQPGIESETSRSQEWYVAYCTIRARLDKALLFPEKAINYKMKKLFAEMKSPSEIRRPFWRNCNIWPWNMILTLELMFEIAPLLTTENNCANLYWNPSINVLRISSIYSNFNIWPWSLTMILDLPEQIFHIMHLFLTLFQTSPGFFSVCSTSLSLENTVGKGGIAHNQQFLFFPQCFLLVWRTFCHFNQIWNCRLQTLWDWRSLTFVIWESVNWEQLCQINP